MLSTYENGYKILNDIRHDLNEFSTARLQGSSTSGVYDNDWIMSKVNLAQRRIYAKLILSIPSQFLTSTTLSFSSSSASLPFDFGRIVELKDDQGRKVYPSTVKTLPITNGSGSDRIYYRKGMSYVLQKSGVTKDYTLWYYSKPRDIIQGKCASDNVIPSGKMVVDYYNGITIEDITGGWIDTVSDYTAAQVVTMASETLSTDDYFGSVSEIPEIFHPFIAPLATMLCRSTHPRTQSPVTKAEYQLWNDGFQDTLNSFGSDGQDVSIEEIFTNYPGDDFSLGGDLFPGESGPY